MLGGRKFVWTALRDILSTMWRQFRFYFLVLFVAQAIRNRSGKFRWDLKNTLNKVVFSNVYNALYVEQIWQ